jgi:hypothetical protein
MASNIDLNINIGANVTDLQSQLQRAENLLKQFEAALKKATNVGEINYLNGQIKNLNTTIASLGQQMNKVGRPAADATNALGNLSRVAQDAPYGFIGIANNLNPLLESFQRLQKESGGSGNALKAMVAGLTGPAGIGIALAAVSSLVVAFGDDISAFIDKTLNGNNAISEQAKALGEAKKAFSEAYIEMYNLGKAFDDFNNGTLSKKDVLEQYNKTLGQVYGTTKDVNEAEKVYRDNTEKYIQATYLRAAADIELKKAAEEAAKAAEAAKMPSTEFTPMFGQAGGFGAGATPTRALNAQREANRRDRITELDERRKFYEDVAKQLREEADLIDKTATKTKDFGKEVVKVSNEIKKIPKAKQEKDIDVTAELRARYKRDTLLAPMEVAPKDTAIEDAEKQHEDYLKWLTKWTKSKEKLAEENIKQDKKDLEDLQKSYERFAETLSQGVTGALFGMFDAMQQGLDAGEALGQMFSRLARSIAESLVQAALFAGILSLISGGAAGGGVSFFGAFKSVLGLADGGVATGPTLAMIGEGSESEAVLPLSKLGGMLDRTFTAGAMSGNGIGQGGQFVLKGNDLVLALQRSNSSLNLRRGV